MTALQTNLANLLDRLEKYYGQPKRPWPTTPYEMILHRNCGYPQSDTLCNKGFRALQKHVGLSAKDILAAPYQQIVSAMREGGMVPELRAHRLLEIAARTQEEFGGDLRILLRKSLAEAKKTLKQFPTIGDPGADKILLFTKTVAVAAIPSNCIHVPLRLGFGDEKKSYAASYRSAQAAIGSKLLEDCSHRLRAYLLLKRHGADLCKSVRPKCEQCPVSDVCMYFQAKRPH